MGKITSENTIFKPASFIFSKIKREFKTFADVNLLDENEFITYALEVLNKLGNITYKEEEAIICVNNKKAELPKDFKRIYAAYRCFKDKNPILHLHLQRSDVVYNQEIYNILSSKNNCAIDINCIENDITKIEVKQYVQEGVISRSYKNPILLTLSPNVKPYCSEDCINIIGSSENEITINNNCVYTNFEDSDIYLQYYSIPFDNEQGLMVPDVVEIEKAIEWYIKYQLLLNFWFVDDLQNALNKWQKAEEQYNMWMGEAMHYSKIPTFNKLVDTIRKQRGINKVTFFSQIDKKR